MVAAIAQTGYHQHGPARALRRSRTDTIALVISEAGYPVLDQMALGVEQEARRLGLTVFLAHSGDDPDQELSAVLALQHQRVDGILIAPVANSRPEIAAIVAESGLPMVLLDRPSPAAVDQVSVDNAPPVAELVNHLVANGHRKIVFVAQGRTISTLDERYDGYESAIVAAGLEPLRVQASSAGSLRAALRALLVSRERPTAIVSASQRSTVRVLQVCQALSMEIPQDVSIVVFDDFPFADVFSPRLTSVVQPARKLGRRAVRLVRRRIENPEARVRKIRLSPRIEFRDSVRDLGPDG